MAYDPDARQSSNTALIVAGVTLAIVVLGGLAYYLTQSGTPAPDANTPVIVTHTNNIVTNNNVPAPASPPTVIVAPTSPPTVIVAPTQPPKVIIRERTSNTVTTNTVTRNVPAPPANAPASAPRTNVNVTINPAANSATTTNSATTDNAANSSTGPGF